MENPIKKQKPLWLKVGIWFAAVDASIFALSYYPFITSASLDELTWNWIIILIVAYLHFPTTALFDVSGILDQLTDNEAFFVGAIFGVLFYFLLGSVIGYCVQKFKTRKAN